MQGDNIPSALKKTISGFPHAKIKKGKMKTQIHKLKGTWTNRDKLHELYDHTMPNCPPQDCPPQIVKIY